MNFDLGKINVKQVCYCYYQVMSIVGSEETHSTNLSIKRFQNSIFKRIAIKMAFIIAHKSDF